LLELRYAEMKKIVKSGVFALLLLTSACIDFDLYDPDDYEYDEEYTNEINPNANQLIIDQSFWGDQDLKSSIINLIETNDGHFFFYGLYNDKHVIGKFSPQGAILWSDEMPYTIKAIRLHQEQLLVCGSQDTDGDEATDAGILVLVDHYGNQLLCSTWNEFDNIRFNGFNEKYIVGRCREGNSIHPFVAEYYIDKLDTIFHGEVKSFSELGNQYFHKIEENYILGAKFRGDFIETEAYEIMIHSLNEKTFNLDWTTNIIAENGYETSEGDLLLVDSLIFVSGNSEVYEPDPPYNQDHWTDGLLGCLTTDGNINFVQTYKSSIRGEKYTGLIYDNNHIYAYGRTSSYWLVMTNDCFSYGLISRIDPENGDAILHYSFGDSRYGSNINTLKLTENGFTLAGHSKQEFYDFDDNTAYQAWFAFIENLSNRAETNLSKTTVDPDQKIKGGDLKSSAPNRQ